MLFCAGAASLVHDAVLDCGRVYSIAGHPLGGFVTGSDPDGVRLWDFACAQVMRLGSEENSNTFNNLLACLADGSVVFGGLTSKLMLWRPSGDATTLLPGVLVRSLAVHPTKQLIVLGYDDHTAAVWDLRPDPPTVLHRLVDQHAAPVGAVAMGADGLVFTSAADGVVCVWKDGLLTHTVVTACGMHTVRCMALLPDGFAVGGRAPDACGHLAVLTGPGYTNSTQFRTEAPVHALVCHSGTLVASTGGGTVLIIHRTSLVGTIVHGGMSHQFFARVAFLGSGQLAVTALVGGSNVASVWSLLRPDRLDAIRVMKTAWEVYRGRPPTSTEDALRGLSQALCLRRFCRVRGADTVEMPCEIVEPFARSIVQFL